MAPDLRGAGAATPPTRASLNKSQPRWHLIYFVLAGFDLLAVSGSLYLGYRLTAILRASVITNREWVVRSKLYSELGQRAAEVNAPGNNVFDTLDPAVQSERLELAMRRFNEEMDSARQDINGMHEVGQRLAIGFSAGLQEVETVMEEMITGAQAILSVFAAGDPNKAGAYMAVMDRKYAKVNALLAGLRERVGKEQMRHLRGQMAASEAVRTFEYSIAGAIVFMVAGITVYGHKLSKSVRAASHEVEQHLAVATESDARLRAIVNTAADGIITINDKGIIESFNHAAERIFWYSAHEAIGKNVRLLIPSPQREGHDGHLPTSIETGEDSVAGVRTEVIGRRKDGFTFPMDLSVNATVVGERRTFTGIVRDVTQRKKAEEDVHRFRAAIDTSADGIFLIDRRTMRFVDASKSACTSVGYTYDEIMAIGPHDIKSDFTKDRLAARLEELVADQTSVGVIETVHRRKDGSCFPVEVLLRFIEINGQQIVVEVARDISERKAAEAQLDELHQKLMDASRQAGMAEIATGVLHNVGNVLNSVNVSASIVSDKMRKSKVRSLAKATDLIRRHGEDLGAFFTEHEKGKMLPGYLAKLSEHLVEEQRSIVSELASLTANIQHIKKIVSTQQSHAGMYGVVESVLVADVVNDALTINATSFERDGIELVREYADLPPIALDKQKLLQILVNLVRNAKYALLDGDGEAKKLTLRITSDGEARMHIDVTDTGVGIARENLTRIFGHGFTTKRDGHGFGLHGSALAAKEMGGSLSVHSDGPGRGATFRLELPFEQAKVEVMV